MKHADEHKATIERLIEDLDAGAADPARAKEIFNGYGKLLKFLSLQVAYAALHNEAPNLPELETRAQVKQIRSAA